LSTLSPDYISWNYFKKIVNDTKCITNIVNIVNSYINLSYWPSYFKKSKSIIVSKSNKPSYNTLKTFHSIVFHNILGKLIKKVISSNLQIHSIASNFVYPNQMGGIKQHSTTDASIYLTHLIWAGWIRDLYTSTLAFDIV